MTFFSPSLCRHNMSFKSKTNFHRIEKVLLEIPCSKKNAR